MGGKIVCGLTSLENATAIRDLYRVNGFRAAKLVTHFDGRWQVIVRGKKNRRITPTGVCNSFGGGIPTLAQLQAKSQ